MGRKNEVKLVVACWASVREKKNRFFFGQGDSSLLGVDRCCRLRTKCLPQNLIIFYFYIIYMVQYLIIWNHFFLQASREVEFHQYSASYIRNTVYSMKKNDNFFNSFSHHPAGANWTGIRFLVIVFKYPNISVISNEKNKGNVPVFSTKLLILISIPFPSSGSTVRG